MDNEDTERKHIIDNVIDSIIEAMSTLIPQKIMCSEQGGGLMYEIIINMLYRFSIAFKLNRETIHAHINFFWDVQEKVKTN